MTSSRPRRDHGVRIGRPRRGKRERAYSRLKLAAVALGLTGNREDLLLARELFRRVPELRHV